MKLFALGREADGYNTGMVRYPKDLRIHQVNRFLSFLSISPTSLCSVVRGAFEKRLRVVRALVHQH